MPKSGNPDYRMQGEGRSASGIRGAIRRSSPPSRCCGNPARDAWRAPAAGLQLRPAAACRRNGPGRQAANKGTPLRCEDGLDQAEFFRILFR